MRVYTGVFKGNGSQRAVSIGARPALVFGFADAATFAAMHSPKMWCGRSNAMSASDSYNKGCSITDDGFVVGDSLLWNTSGSDTHWVALVPTSVSDFDVVSHMGNAIAGTTYVTPQARPIVAAILKRDSSLTGIVATNVSAPATLNSVGVGTWLSAIGTGQVTVTAESEVNQLDGPGGLGEETTGIYLYQSDTVKTSTYVGLQSMNAVIATTPNPIKMAIVYRVTPGGASARIITDTMANKTKPVNAAALQSSELAISGNLLTVGAAATALNMAGVTYGVIAICDGTAVVKAPALVRSKGKRGVLLSGVASSIDCGTADGSLLISGPITTEWCGAIYPTAADNTDCPLFLRHGGAFNAAGSASWGMNGFRSADGAFAWPGLQANVITSERLINAPDIRQGWRTGIALPFGQLFHLAVVHLGGGSWQAYLNGELVKQRKIDATVVSLPNIASTSGHKTSIGARWNGSAMVSPQKLLHRTARVYNVALTQDEIAIRFQRLMLGSTTNDVIRGLAEEWDAANASSLSQPATLSSTNNGTITAGSVVTL